jgi:hypothetical protein
LQTEAKALPFGMDLLTALTITEKTSDDTLYGSIGQVTVRTAVMKEPNSNSAILARIVRGDEVTILGTEASGRWYKIKTAQGVVGWSPARLITIIERAVPQSPLPQDVPSKPVALENEPVSKNLDPDSVLVWPIKFSGMMPKGFINQIQFALVDSAKSESGHPALTLAEAWQLLGAKGEELPGCGFENQSCVVEIGRKLVVRYHIVAKLELGEGGWILSLCLLDAARSIETNRSLATFDGTEESLRPAMGPAVAKLFGHATEPPLVAPLPEAEPVASPLPAQASQETKTEEPAEERTVESNSETASAYTIAGGTLIGLGVAALLGAGVTTYLAYNSAQDYQSGNLSAKSTNQTWTTVSIAGYSAGGALLVTGIVLLAIDPDAGADHSEPQPMLGLTKDGQGPMLSLSGRW